jgi:hypothetical protein
MVVDKSKDYLQQLANYIKSNLAKGYTLDSLKVSLTNQGYSRIAINNAIALANQQLAQNAPPMKERPVITYKAYQEEPIEKPKKSLKHIFKKIFKRR